ncbi:MAG: FUSC family protein, partial [Aequorivita sp.]|nr:FUSC family protein [Aequorivita sp.]
KNFNLVAERIVQNLKKAESILKEEIPSQQIPETESAEDIFEATFGKSIPFSEDEKNSKSESFHSQMEEAHLVREQLKWLLAMSEKMPKLLREIEF